MRLVINIYRSKWWEMTKKRRLLGWLKESKISWDDTGKERGKAGVLACSFSSERVGSTANAEGIQNRSSRGEAVSALEAWRAWRQFPRSLNSFHTGWTDLGYTELVHWQEHSTPAQELVTYSENLWKNRVDHRNTEDEKDLGKLITESGLGPWGCVPSGQLYGRP